MCKVQSSRSLVRLLFLCAGGVLICAAIYSGVRTARFIGQASLAEGTVIENVAALDTSDNHVTYHPKIHFRTRDGHEIHIVSSSAADRPAYQVGQTVALLYDPSDPKRAKIRGFWNLWLSTVILSGLGAVFAGIGFANVGLAASEDMYNAAALGFPMSDVMFKRDRRQS